MTMPCIVLGQPLLLGLSHAYTIIGLGLLASVGGQLPVSGRCMQQLLQFRFGSHQFTFVLGRFAGGQGQ